MCMFETWRETVFKIYSSFLMLSEGVCVYMKFTTHSSFPLMTYKLYTRCFTTESSLQEPRDTLRKT